MVFLLSILLKKRRVELLTLLHLYFYFQFFL